MTNSVPRDPICACQRRPTPKPRSNITPNLELSHDHRATNKIPNDNSHPRHPQCAITSEGGHTSDTTSITSEGAHSLPGTLAPQLVSRRLLRNGLRPHDNLPRVYPLVKTAPIQRSHPPSHRERNGILGTHERSPYTTALDAMIWQRMRTPIPRNPRHSRNRYL
jgi:hypothetical protein